MKKIGIVTLHSAHNYGSVFQAYAMAKIMQKLGLDAKIIDYRHPKTSAMYEFSWWSKQLSFKANISRIILRGLFGIGRTREQRFNAFIEKNMPLTVRYDNRSEIKEKFDYLVCGSDQIWNPKASSKNDPAYFLDFGDKDVIRFSYAASSGGADFAEGAAESRIKRSLENLKKVGVREASMQSYIAAKFNLESSVNPDPTALLEVSDWVKLEEPVEKVPEKFVLVYSIREMPKTVAFAAKVGKKMNLPVVHINQARGRNARIKIDNVTSLDNPSPGQFLWLYHKAAFVVSNTFHGNMFSVIYGKNFVWYKTNPNDARMLTLHNALGFGQKYQIGMEEPVDNINAIVEYDANKLSALKKLGFDYIESVLN